MCGTAPCIETSAHCIQGHPTPDHGCALQAPVLFEGVAGTISPESTTVKPAPGAHCLSATASCQVWWLHNRCGADAAVMGVCRPWRC